VQLKGKYAAIGIHECFSGNAAPILENKLLTLDLYKNGMLAYINRSFEEAANAFEEIIMINPSDLTARLFLSNARRYLHHGVPDNWSGVEEMLNK